MVPLHMSRYADFPFEECIPKLCEQRCYSWSVSIWQLKRKFDDRMSLPGFSQFFHKSCDCKKVFFFMQMDF